ncbi:MAG: gp436 family protein [Halothiobacillus sp.]
MYATQADMEARFGTDELIQLTDHSNAGVIDTTTMTQALTDADAEVNLYLARYNPPLVSVPPMLVVVACDIARYRLYGDGALDIVQKRYDAAVAKLAAIAAGKIDLGLSDGTPAALGAPTVDPATPARVWSADTLKDY